jgi:chloramphenicol-sensitive protein RarD
MRRPDYPAGVAYGLLAYVIWGCFPLFFRQLAQVAPMDILANRTAWAFVFVTLLLALRGRWQRVVAFATTPGHRLRLPSPRCCSAPTGSLPVGGRPHQVVESSSVLPDAAGHVLLGLVVLANG